MSSEEETATTLDLVYELVRDVLPYQERTAATIDGKAIALFTVASLVVGIGVPVVLGQLQSAGSWMTWFAALPAAAYLAVVVAAYVALRPRAWGTVNNPMGIRNPLAYLAPQDFKEKILDRTEEAFEANRKQLEGKSRALKWLVPAVAVEVALVLLWVSLVAAVR